MTAPRRAFVLTGILSIVAMQVVFVALLMRPQGVRMSYPAPRAVVPLETAVAGDAWIRGGIERVEVRVRDAGGRDIAAVPAERDTVRYKGRVAAVLAAWRATVRFPSPGAYSLAAAAVGRDGQVIEGQARAVTADSSARAHPFRHWSALHIVPIVLVAALSVLLPLLVRRARSVVVRDRVALALSLVLWLDEIPFQVWWFLRGAWTVGNSIMLHMCGLAILFIPLLFFTEDRKWRQYLFEILYFFGLGGALQALFAPDIGVHGFPEPKYFCFFISHGTIIISMVFAAALYDVDLTWKSWIRVVVVTNVCTFAAYGVNLLLRLLPPYELGNYFVIGYPPPNGSIVDLFADIFGPAPRYLVGLEVMGLLVFGLLYTPFAVRRLIRKRAARPAG